MAPPPWVPLRSSRVPPLFTALILLGSLGGLTGGRAAHAQAVGAACGSDDLLAGKLPVESEDVSGTLARVTDGAVGAEGTEWDAPVTVTLANGTAALTYDLGRVQSVGAIVVQADANDTYKVLGSRDGRPDSYRQIVQLANIVDRGPGLRTRALRFPPVDVRYLRVGFGEGDNAYSLSEVAVYCRAPEPFPPVLHTVEAPSAVVPAPAAVSAAGAPDPRAATSRNRFEWVMLALALAVLALGTSMMRRKSGAAAPERRGPSDGALRLMFLASGCAALIYEIVWFHLLRLVIGASALSVAIVLASFMGGMFLGSLLFARFVPPGRPPLRVYALLEIGVGVFGLLMPLALPAIRSVYVGLFGYGALGIALRAVIAAVMLLPPTALMGATLPAVARRFSSGAAGMSRLAGLYTANTAGAVLGCLLSAFYLLAVWDVWVATLAAATLNFAIGWFALRTSRREGAAAVATSSGDDASAAPIPAPGQPQTRETIRTVYLAAALSGFTALGAQVIWTRLLTLLFGATVYAFAIILAVFLAGLGLGSGWATRLLRRNVNPVRAFAWSQLLLIPAVFFSAELLANFLPYASPPASTPLFALHGLHVLRAAAVILPAAVLWGLSFPLALAAAGAGHGDTGQSSGYVYAANTVGAIAGALLISFLAIPELGTQWAQQILIAASALSAAVLWRLMSRGPASGRVFSPVWPLALGALAAAFLPGMSKAFLAHGRYIWWVDERDQYPYVSEGAASTVAVHVAPDGYRNFHVSGRVEASNNPNDMRLQRLLGHLSALAHPHPESVLVVGLGAGVTAGALSLHPEVKRIVICEIEPRVVGAANQFAPENYAVLQDPRVQVVFDDARHFLATTREKFDVITSDPIHPWVRGNSILFSREYYAIVAARLNPGGLATQWVPLYETSELAIQIQMRTFMEAFPNGTVWNSAVSGRGYDVVMMGSVQPLHIDVPAVQRRLDASPRIAQSLRDVKIGSVLDLLSTYGASGPDMRTWLAQAPVNRDFSVKLEYISGLALNNREADSIYAHMIAGRAYPADLFVAPPALDADLRRRLLTESISAR